MRRKVSNCALIAALTVTIMLSACGGAVQAPASAPATQIGVLTSLPIYWPESDTPADLISPNAAVPWPRALIEQHHTLLPLDALDGPQGLARVTAAVLAQPRPLTAAENVALDDWVRSGGHALVFADPALTAESRFHLGDRRRPQDVILLSPILKRWGLTLSFDEAGPAGERTVKDPVAGALPVNLAGVIAIATNAGESAGQCRIEAGGVVARCRIGRGSATIVADAALFEAAEEAESAGASQRAAALSALIDSLARDAAGTRRERAGNGLKSRQAAARIGLADHGERG